MKKALVFLILMSLSQSLWAIGGSEISILNLDEVSGDLPPGTSAVFYDNNLNKNNTLIAAQAQEGDAILYHFCKITRDYKGMKMATVCRPIGHRITSTEILRISNERARLEAEVGRQILPFYLSAPAAAAIPLAACLIAKNCLSSLAPLGWSSAAFVGTFALVGGVNVVMVNNRAQKDNLAFDRTSVVDLAEKIDQLGEEGLVAIRVDSILSLNNALTYIIMNKDMILAPK